MEGEAQKREHNEREADVGVWGLGIVLNEGVGSGDGFCSIIDESEWQKVS